MPGTGAYYWLPVPTVPGHHWAGHRAGSARRGWCRPRSGCSGCPQPATVMTELTQSFPHSGNRLCGIAQDPIPRRKGGFETAHRPVSIPMIPGTHSVVAGRKPGLVSGSRCHSNEVLGVAEAGTGCMLVSFLWLPEPRGIVLVVWDDAGPTHVECRKHGDVWSSADEAVPLASRWSMHSEQPATGVDK